MRVLARSLFIIAVLLTSAAYSQTVTDCPHPSGCVVLSGDAARAALQAGDKAAALEVQLKAEQDAKELLRKALDDMRIEFARVSGENTALRQNAVQDRAIITAMIPMLRQKVVGIKIF